MTIRIMTACAALMVALVTFAHAAGQPTYKTPEAAARALVEAIASGDDNRIMAVLGPQGRDIVSSGDKVEDRNARQRFLTIVKQHADLVAVSKTVQMLRLGNEKWPFPIPIVKVAGGWMFDTVKGRQEIINRRIGRDELNAIDVCHSYVDAQREYAARVGQGAYAQRFMSTPGKKDGLYWDVPKGSKPSPLGPLVGKAAGEGYTEKGKGQPFHGYLFRVLTSQGANAPGGAKAYVQDGKMKGGFALVAWPAVYGKTGIMTFIVNQAGVVFEKNLGQDTATAAAGLQQFDPDGTWKVVRTP